LGTVVVVVVVVVVIAQFLDDKFEAAQQ